MNVIVEKTDGLSRLQIEGEMTVFHAAELKKDLLDNLAGCSKLDIDLSQVSEMDTAGFQLLFLIKREAGISDKPMRITAHSPATLSALKLYGMDEEVF
jgi:anti-anti-sigma factor